MAQQVPQDVGRPRLVTYPSGSVAKYRPTHFCTGETVRAAMADSLSRVTAPPAQDRRPADGGPGAADQGVEEGPALVDQDEVGVPLLRFFFSASHWPAAHRSIAAWSRPWARRAGF